MVHLLSDIMIVEGNKVDKVKGNQSKSLKFSPTWVRKDIRIMVLHGRDETHISNGNNFFWSLTCFLLNRDQKTSTQRKHRAAVLSNERAPPCVSSDLGSSSVQRLDVEEVGTSSEACF